MPSWGKKAAEPAAPSNPAVPEFGTAQPRKGANLLPGKGNNAMKECGSNHGTLQFNKLDSIVGKSLDLYGEFGTDTLSLLSQIVRSSDHIVHAGAGVGALTSGLARFVGDGGQVYAYEPQRAQHQMLCGNLALNGLNHVQCNRGAVGAKEGQIVVPSVNYDEEGCHGCLSLDDSNFLGETVPLVSVDSLSLMRCRLIFADVEGMELDVIQGAEKTIRNFKPALYMKAHFTAEDNTLSTGTQKLARFVQSLNYDMYWHFSRYFVEENYFENSENVFGEEQALYILAVPHVEGSKIEGLEPVEVPPEE